jgi:hypothetical protein
MSALRNRRTILLRMSGHGMRDRAGVQAGDRRDGDGYGDRRVPCRGVVPLPAVPLTTICAAPVNIKVGTDVMVIVPVFVTVPVV